jgi:hypothetical protein
LLARFCKPNVNVPVIGSILLARNISAGFNLAKEFAQRGGADASYVKQFALCERFVLCQDGEDAALPLRPRIALAMMQLVSAAIKEREQPVFPGEGLGVKPVSGSEPMFDSMRMPKPVRVPVRSPVRNLVLVPTLLPGFASTLTSAFASVPVLGLAFTLGVA